jgi:tight adherence protein B
MISILVALLAFLVVAGVGVALTGGDSAASKRAKELKAGKTQRRPRKDLTADAAAKRRATVQQGLKELVRKEQTRKKSMLSVRARLEQADLPLSEQTFWIASVVVGLVLAVVAFVFSGQSPLWGVIAFIVGTFGLPRWVVAFLIGRRQKMFSEQLADALDMITRGVKSGLPLGQCLRIIAAEAPVPLRTEFAHIVDGQAMGVPLEQNLGRLYERMPLAEVNFFNIVLVIQQKTGGNLSESLGNLSQVLRARKLMREKVKALSSEAKASAYIIGSLPFIVMGMVHMTRPDYIAILFTDPQGQLVLIGAGVMMSLGIYVMRTMINFKF